MESRRGVCSLSCFSEITSSPNTHNVYGLLAYLKHGRLVFDRLRKYYIRIDAFGRGVVSLVTGTICIYNVSLFSWSGNTVTMIIIIFYKWTVTEFRFWNKVFNYYALSIKDCLKDFNIQEKRQQRQRCNICNRSRRHWWSSPRYDFRWSISLAQTYC